MKRPVIVAIIVTSASASAMVYARRDILLCRFSAISSATRIEESSYRASVLEARGWSIQPTAEEVRRIRRDLWCLRMKGNLWDAKEVGEYRLVRVTATDRTDTEFIYVFDRHGGLLQVIRKSMA